eukprot:c13043_g1_i2.p1 GENE.c13043_g1_i2~~c13043_g1_i2.p1  ORF type:complete len:100 (+),score=12.38 c13043_g1_i2:128-427(+)
MYTHAYHISNHPAIAQRYARLFTHTHIHAHIEHIHAHAHTTTSSRVIAQQRLSLEEDSLTYLQQPLRVNLINPLGHVRDTALGTLIVPSNIPDLQIPRL